MNTHEYRLATIGAQGKPDQWPTRDLATVRLWESLTEFAEEAGAAICVGTFKVEVTQVRWVDPSFVTAGWEPVTRTVDQYHATMKAYEDVCDECRPRIGRMVGDRVHPLSSLRIPVIEPLSVR